MKKILRLMLFLLMAPTMVLASETKQVIKETSSDLAQNATSAIMIEASSGKILFEKNSHEKLAPASMTKMMSMLLIV